jgi:hypothetical protein
MRVPLGHGILTQLSNVRYNFIDGSDKNISTVYWRYSTHEMKHLPYHYAKAPNGTKSLKVFFPRNAFGLHLNPLGGVSFYAPGLKDVDMTTDKELTFGYSMFFDTGFVYNKGGKLPGICTSCLTTQYTHHESHTMCGVCIQTVVTVMS